MPSRSSSARILAAALAAAVLFIGFSARGLATFASPPSGLLKIKIGQILAVKVFGVAGCTFDYVANSSIGGIVAFNAANGSGLKSTTVELTGLGVGTTNVTIATAGGTCPPALHSYTVTVEPDLPGAVKAFDAKAKAELSAFKLDLKVEYGTWLTESKGIAGQILSGALDYDTGIAQANDLTRDAVNSICMKSMLRLTNLRSLGSTLLEQNALAPGDGPPGFFPGGCGTWDKFNGSLCAELEKTEANMKKQSSTLILGLEKKGFPKLGGTLFYVPRPASTGPLYPNQTNTEQLPYYAAYTIGYSKPATNVAKDNGKIVISGRADSVLGPDFELTLTKVENGQPDQTTTTLAPITSWSFNHTFDNLTPGTYTLHGRYPGDTGVIGVAFHVGVDAPPPSPPPVTSSR